jgi:hypothetical protein
MVSMPAHILHAFVLLLLSISVAGHGFVKTVTVDGTDYPGFDPNTDPYASPVPARVIRKIPSDGPGTSQNKHLRFYICRSLITQQLQP